MSSVSPPPSRTHRVPIAVAGAVALLVVVGVALLAARTEPRPEMAPGRAGVPPLATPATAPTSVGSSALGPASAVVGPRSAATSGADVRPPEIAGQSAEGGGLTVRGCAGDVTTIEATVADVSGVRSVTLSWSMPDGEHGTTRMARGRGGSWSARLGPFSRPGEVVWQVVATDTAGNTATGAPARLIVEGCPSPATTLS
ncbi:hypothetical protein [Prauserella endophytica]|uniref:Ig-like domain-containing protein n=1 Tax=Prauserella endophytica TaxID=1592324 RepID=A0ABY2SCB9_9PSEU|nr:hypothetical protein [Prauserella endophytica]TKG73495.1 hypothetical protein FCN18_02725 [Prauserella endophytica]